jgi:hypothetical protein
MRFTLLLFYFNIISALPFHLLHTTINTIGNGLTKVLTGQNQHSVSTKKILGNNTTFVKSSNEHDKCPKTLIIIKREGLITENEAKNAITAACPNFDVSKLGIGRIIRSKRIIYHTNHKDLKVIGRNGVQFGDCPVSLNANYITKIKRFCWF